MRTARAISAAAVLLALAAGLAACGGRDNSQTSMHAARRPKPPPELPRGGRTLFPHYRVVAYYGAPQAHALGVLGIGSPDQAARRLRRQARSYSRRRRPTLPALELIAVVASGAPEKGAAYSYRQKARVVDRYLAAARRAHALLVLDVQPGRSSFMKEVRWLRPWLEQPDVALALDPEWAVGPDQVPGQNLGSTNARTVNRVSRYLARIVREHRLPQKLFVVHAFTPAALPDSERIKQRAGLAVTVNADGFGPPGSKIEEYHQFARKGRPNGFKLFFHEDQGLMSPHDVLALRPRPDLIVYE